MQVDDFKRIISSFAETPASFDLSKGEFVVQLLDEVLTARLERKSGVLYVDEDGISQPAESWIVKRVAKLPQLAERILSYVPELQNFVTPTARLLPNLEEDPHGRDVTNIDALAGCEQVLSTQMPGTTQVTYLTSDAGEGKTTLINALARQVATDYKNKTKDWLLLPVPLGGRAFLRFDELVVSALMNRFRFQYWFFDGFIELVRLGVVVPAFDGFEEMIVEGSSGEAVSALGNLMNQLNSDGRVLLAARKAFFEYQSFKTQARLFDAIGSEDSVSFSRLALLRWSRAQFEEYGEKRGRSDSSEIYEQVAARFGASHPLLTRAVLVRRLFDVTKDLLDVTDLLSNLGSRPQDYFHQFVLAIIEREAAEKWLDKEGREGHVLLTVDEHLDLLAAVAREMWVSTTDVLREDVIDVIADLFCDERKKSPAISRQIRERLKTHALLVRTSGSHSGLAFDHEDFKEFFIGIALGHVLRGANREDIRTFLRVAAIPEETIDEALLIYDRADGSRSGLVSSALAVGEGELPTSFVLENAGNLALKALSFQAPCDELVIRGLNFGPSALQAKGLTNIRFEDCYFGPTSLMSSKLVNVQFVRCRFERLEMADEMQIDAALDASQVSCVVDGDETIFDPAAITHRLTTAGFDINMEGLESYAQDVEVDRELIATEKVVRAFVRGTQHNEDTLRVKLGLHSSAFFDSALPELLRAGVLEDVPYRGSGNQKRYRLVKHMSLLQDAVARAGGSFERFLIEAREA